MTDKASGGLDADDPLFAPGLRRRERAKREVRYWIPPQHDVRKGFPQKSLTLDPALNELELAARCRELWIELEAWREGKPQDTRYSIGWLIDRYLTDEFSPYRNARPKTRSGYDYNCRVIRKSIGDRLINPTLEGGVMKPRITGPDIRRWHTNWGKPVAVAGDDGRETFVASAPSRARHCAVQLRILFSYAVEIAVPGAVEIKQILSTIEFPTTPPRTKAPTLEQVRALVREAEAQGYLSIAIATLAQFELTERRVHIIGDFDRGRWIPGWVWENVSSEWVIRYTQDKVAPIPREFCLATVQPLLMLMQKIPVEKRHGAIIKCENTGQPWRARAFSNAFRKIARKAGIPDDVWSMDMRAGGATEADAIPAITPRMLQDGLGHMNLSTQERYRRGKQRNAQNVVTLRQASRKND